MNKERKGRFNDVISSLEEAKGELEDILNEEQDSYDSLPDGLQMSSRGEKMQDYIGLMEELYKQDRWGRWVCGRENYKEKMISICVSQI